MYLLILADIKIESLCTETDPIFSFLSIYLVRDPVELFPTKLLLPFTQGLPSQVLAF